MIKKIDLCLALISSLLISFLVVGMDKLYKIYIPFILFVGIYLGLLALWFTFAFIFSLFINTKKEYTKQNPIVDKIITLTMELLLNLTHTKVIKENIELVPKNERFLLVYNHTSKFDPIVINYVLKKYKIIHVSKPENFKVPIAGPFVYRNCYLAIDRHNDRNALKTIQKAIDYINNKEFSIGIAPEGTRNKGNPKELLPFRDGCFKIATKTNCKIVVCTLKGNEMIHKNFPFKRNKVTMNITEVIDSKEYEGLTTVDISKHVHEIMMKELNEKEEL